MKGLDSIENGMMGECWWTPGSRHQPIPGRPFSDEEKIRLDLLIAQGRIVMRECPCGQLHPVITPAGHDAIRLQKLANNIEPQR